jgi:hypothetical protein
MEHPLTPGGPEQDHADTVSDEQRAIIASAAPMLGEEAGDLLLRLAAEVQRVAGGGMAADVQNAVLHELARLREEAVMREQEKGVGDAAGGSRPGANAGDVQATMLAVCRRSGSLQKLVRSRHLAAQQAINRTLRKLSRRRRDLIRATYTGSLFSPSPSESGDNNGGGGEIEQPPNHSAVLPLRTGGAAA